MTCLTIDQPIRGHSKNCFETCSVGPQSINQFDGPVFSVAVHHLDYNGLNLSVSKLYLTTCLRMVRGGHFVFHTIFSHEVFKRFVAEM